MKQAKLIPSMGIIPSSLDTRLEGDTIIAEGLCITKIRGSRERFDTDKVKIDIPVQENAIDISFKSRYGRKLPGGAALNRFKLEIDIKKAEDWDIQNKLLINYDGRGENRISYSIFDRKRGRNHNSRIFIKDGLAMYFRQNVNNSIFFTIRDANQYDTEEGQARIERAYKNSKQHRDKDIVLMYEKNCARYEESASVLYEKLIDEGFDNVYYIVDTGIPAVQGMDERYRQNLIEKDSDRHLEYFFACDKFISTETIDHALQLRIANKRVQDKITGKGLSYVFLQHGVMYMVSLNSALRVGFRQKKGYKLHRTVVSSEAEAQHFMDLAGMKRGNLYITGLAKFDKSYRNEGADKIVIMPTWRRWETNQAKHDIRQSGYYKMIERMYNAVPGELKDKVVILPHPLMAERFEGEKDGIGGHLRLTDSYDVTLRDCDLLITDYSSIAYDAFYRGANTIFCWEEKDECMRHYGEETHLMLNEDNAFGRVCMNEAELRTAISETYGRAQSEKDRERYDKIVEFSDGRNSERIIECLKRDKMI
ncbi:MAG: CDP-glycerol glycerophosphotransferase family protein [Mogibacterium sp.]|nr:CDP-glycerol glycerophosphotransferase family protein [Mogibacterium sp.]